jgi:hypothetical protein
MELWQASAWRAASISGHGRNGTSDAVISFLANAAAGSIAIALILTADLVRLSARSRFRLWGIQAGLESLPHSTSLAATRSSLAPLAP